jgi:hypothetical protein
MGLLGEQLTAIQLLLRAIDAECRSSPLGNLLEGHLKTICANSLLSHGYSILEGAGFGGQGRLVSIRDGRLVQSLEPLPPMQARSDSDKKRLSPDLRVWRPCRLTVELQVRTQFGSQGALFSDNVVDDLDRIRRRVADVFILAADAPIYDSLRGIKAETRGRKPKHPELLERLLPPSSRLPTALAMGNSVSCDDLEWVGSSFQTTFGVERVVVAGWGRG